jgi:RNA recognition motif-containing protein
LGNDISKRLGGVRLTEFVDKGGEGYVRRLNNEATSFFITNFPEDVLVVDLWRIFAKFGRVGEVYIPSKKDKWGRGFGFVKFFEVGNVEELSLKLSEVWCGTYKLRINLSRFGKGDKKVSMVQHSVNGGSRSFSGGVAKNPATDHVNKAWGGKERRM